MSGFANTITPPGLSSGLPANRFVTYPSARFVASTGFWNVPTDDGAGVGQPEHHHVRGLRHLDVVLAMKRLEHPRADLLGGPARIANGR